MPNSIADPSDLAELSTLRSQIGEITARIVAVADRYAPTPDSAAATDLFAAERYLVNARRAIDRATGTRR